jgi:hypothetical protein
MMTIMMMAPVLGHPWGHMEVKPDLDKMTNAIMDGTIPGPLFQLYQEMEPDPWSQDWSV